MELPAHLIDDISVDLIGKHVRALEGVRHPVAAPAALARAGGYIVQELQALGYDIGEHRFEEQGAGYSNILATRRGTSHPEQLVLTVAHFDTVSATPGADDNASGVAVLLELARVLQRCQFERTVQFVAVNLEEHTGDDGSGVALRGSRALARHARESGWEVEGVVVLESVAYAGSDLSQSAPPGLPLDVPESGDFIAVVGNENSQGLVQEFCRGIERCGIPLPFLAIVVPGNGEVLPDTRRSDHASFWDCGYRAIMLTDTAQFRNPHYHQPTDTLGTLNLEFAAKVCRATALWVEKLAGRVGS